jgi:hypothetical protein
MASSSRRHVYSLATLLLVAALAACHPRLKPIHPSVIKDLEGVISQRWQQVETLKLYGEVELARGDGIHQGYVELWYKSPWHLRADLTHDKDTLVGMVFYKGSKSARESWGYYPGQWSIIKGGQPPDPPLQPPHAEYLRKLTGFMRSDAHHVAALLTGHLLDTTRLPYTGIQKVGKSYVLTGNKDPGLVTRIAVWRKEPVLEHVEYPKQVLNPNETTSRKGLMVMKYGHFTEVNGIPFPMVVNASPPGNGWSLEFRYKMIEVNPEFDDNVFQKPGRKKPTEKRKKPWEKVL